MKPRWFVRGDVDGFFGLLVDNLLQLMLIDVLCRAYCGFDDELITRRILPGAAISILIGNAFYARQAVKLMRATGRSDVTALPYGINTPSLLAYVFLIMKPVYDRTQDATLAWQAGLFACLLSGVMEVLGSFVGGWLRRHTPRAALLSALAGVALTFIAMGFVFQMFAYPLISLVPMVVVLASYGARIRWPFGLPGGLVAVALGAVLAWTLHGFSGALAGWSLWEPPSVAWNPGLRPPLPAFGDVFALLLDEEGWRFLGVIVPMGLFNVIGSLQNLESAEAAGDAYPVRSSLLANGVGTLAAAFFGSAFPTTIYIGHPGWKAMGARAGYSVLNGAVIAVLCLGGGVSLVLRYVPLEAMLPILLWIGVVITAQAFQAVPRSHAVAVAVGLIPAVAAWGRQVLIGAALPAGEYVTAADTLPASGVYLRGMLALEQGFLLSAMILSAVVVLLVEGRLLAAAAWLGAAALLSAVGLIHAYQLTPFGPLAELGLAAAPEFALAYGASALLLVVLHRTRA